MRTRWLLVIAAGVLAFGYLLGNFLPVEILRPTGIGTEISRNDYISRGISLLAVFATLCATIVALFKEDILALFRSPRLSAKFRDKGVLMEQTVVEQADNGSARNMIATSYEVVIVVSNVGKLVAKGCQIMLERLEFRESERAAAKEIFVADPTLQWLNRGGEGIHIPKDSSALVRLVQIESPGSSIVASGTGQVPANPRLSVGKHQFGEISGGGVYVAEFSVHSENARSVRFRIEFDWRGQWERRLSEMKDRVNIRYRGCGHD